MTTRIISPCWFLEGGPQHEEGGGISGNGTDSITGEFDAEENSGSVGLFSQQEDNFVSFLLLQHPLEGGEGVFGLLLQQLDGVVVVGEMYSL